jgi:hypothetical protein
MLMLSGSLVLMSRHQNAGQSHNIERASRSCENVAKFKHQGTTVTINLIHHGIKSRFNSGNACYHSIQNLLFSHLLSKNEIDETVIFL